MTGELEARMARWIVPLWCVFAALYAAATVATRLASPFLFQRVGHPLWIGLTVVAVAAIVAIPVLSARGKAGAAFAASAVSIAGMILVTAVSAYPVLVPSSLDLANSLTIFNASSTPRLVSLGGGSPVDAAKAVVFSLATGVELSAADGPARARSLHPRWRARRTRPRSSSGSCGPRGDAGARGRPAPTPRVP